MLNGIGGSYKYVKWKLISRLGAWEDLKGLDFEKLIQSRAISDYKVLYFILCFTLISANLIQYKRISRMLSCHYMSLSYHGIGVANRGEDDQQPQATLCTTPTE